MALPTSDNENGPWYHATQRCLEACDDMAQAMRDVSGMNLLLLTPYHILCLFVAARFYIGKPPKPSSTHHTPH